MLKMNTLEESRGTVKVRRMTPKPLHHHGICAGKENILNLYFVRKLNGSILELARPISRYCSYPEKRGGNNE